MRINAYAEEMTDRIEIIEKKTAEGTFTGVRFYMELPVTVQADGVPPQQVSGPVMHHEGDDDSSAATFWGKHNLHHRTQDTGQLVGHFLAVLRQRPTDRGVTFHGPVVVLVQQLNGLLH